MYILVSNIETLGKLRGYCTQTHFFLLLRYYSTAQRHCPLTRRPEPARALIVNI